MTAGLFLTEIVARLGGTLVDDNGVKISQAASLRAAGPGHISFLAQSKFLGELAVTKAGAVIVGEGARDATCLPRIVASNPYAYFARVSQLFNRDDRPAPGIHPTAVVEASANVATSASVGPLCYIGKGASLGKGATIGALCYVGDDVSIANDVCIRASVTIYHGCEIGERTIVHSGVVVGADGFGFAEDASAWVKIPQIGRVIIGADVEIGANTTIDRGTIEDTVIEDGVKLDNQIQVGHNVRICAHTAIAGCTGIAGSAKIGRRCKIGGAAMIAGHISITDDVTLDGGTVVIKAISRPGRYGGPLPSSDHGRWLRNAAQLRRLDELSARVRELVKNSPRKRLDELAKRVEELEARLSETKKECSP